MWLAKARSRLKEERKDSNQLVRSLRRAHMHSLRKHAYSNILKISPPKNENFRIKNSNIFFHISALNIECGYSLEPPRPRRGGSNEYPQSMF